MITVHGPVRISTDGKRGNVVIALWSDGSVSFETEWNGKQRRYWMLSECKGRITLAKKRKK